MFLIDISKDNRSGREDEFTSGPRYNIAPTQPIDCVLQPPNAGRHVIQARWGLIPAWAADISIGNRMINARGETVDTKPSFRNAFAKRRCLIPTDGYYEWKKVADGKQPYLIQRADHGVMAMAGLWEDNTKASVDNQTIRSCTVITTCANTMTKPIHDRMPVFVNESDFEQWLDPTCRDSDRLKQLLRPAADSLLVCDTVSRRVNSPKNDDAACIEPVPNNTLFD